MSRSSRPTVRAAARLFASEVKLVFRRRRNQVLLVVLALGPLLLGAAVKASAPTGTEGPQFLDRVAGNGLFLVFGTLTVMLPVFLPLVVAIVAGDSVAGEASLGTLRYLLTVPVPRARLLVTKWLAATTFTVTGVAVLAVAALASGAALFPIGPVTLLSGNTVPLGDGLLRAAAIAGYVAVSLLGLITVGLAFSTFTEVPLAATALTVGFAILCTVLDTVPQVSWLHPYLISHHWIDFGELLRSAPRAGPLLAGIWTQAAYTAIAGALAWSRFTTADVTC